MVCHKFGISLVSNLGSASDALKAYAPLRWTKKRNSLVTQTARGPHGPTPSQRCCTDQVEGSVAVGVMVKPDRSLREKRVPWNSRAQIQRWPLPFPTWMGLVSP